MTTTFKTTIYWADRGREAHRFAPLESDVAAEIAVIGGGILGASTALHLAEARRDVALVEAGDIGHGASGRNTGFVVPSLKSLLGPEDVERALGPVHAERLLRLVAGSGNTVFDLVDRHGIDCDAIRSGWLQAGHSEAAETMLEARLPRLRDMGVAVEFCDRARMQAMTGLPWVHGGHYLPSGGQIDPLAYVRGLAFAAERAGARVHAHSPATAIRPDGSGWRVETPRGAIRAERVILATNAMVGRLIPALARSIVPVRVFQVTSEPLPDDARRRILPAGAPVTDTRRHTFALRWSPDGRLMTGGMVPPGFDRAGAAVRRFARRLAAQVPGLGEIRPSHVWSGRIAVTLDALPRMIELAPGLHGAIGCNGRGVALTSALGRELAGWYASGGETSFVLPITPPRPVPFARLSGLGPHLALPWLEMRDAMEIRPSGRNRPL
ncbi:FAD-dependent oxidoreductase [Rhodobacterales bacterium HKCCE2091]|nr:FAD-dependent oxidoreductase [Rhodobacterales bacterium HKCCE2091]